MNMWKSFPNFIGKKPVVEKHLENIFLTMEKTEFLFLEETYVEHLQSTKG